jgi:hypothetical protein
VARDAVGALGHLEGPLIVEQGFVGGAEARVVDFDENLVWARLLDRDFLDGNGCAVARALLDSCFLGLREAHDVYDGLVVYGQWLSVSGEREAVAEIKLYKPRIGRTTWTGAQFKFILTLGTSCAVLRG